MVPTSLSSPARLNLNNSRCDVISSRRPTNLRCRADLDRYRASVLEFPDEPRRLFAARRLGRGSLVQRSCISRKDVGILASTNGALGGFSIVFLGIGQSDLVRKPPVRMAFLAHPIAAFGFPACAHNRSLECRQEHSIGQKGARRFNRNGMPCLFVDWISCGR